MTTSVPSTPHPLFAYELKNAVVSLLTTLPEVVRVNHLKYWNEHIFFVTLRPSDAGTAQRVEAALQQFLEGAGRDRIAAVRWRFLAEGDPVPSSRTLYRR